MIKFHPKNILVIFLILFPTLLSAKEFSVKSVKDIHKALKEAKTGDTINISPGQYDMGNSFKT